MNRRQFFLSSALPALAQRTAAPPNIIVILTDDQGYGDLSSHGNPVLKTPAMDRLRAESVRLTDFHVAPMCTPTRSQLLTGRDALANGAMNVSSGRTLLRRDIPTLPELLAPAGYRSGLFGKWHLGDAYPYRPSDRGFDECVWFPSSHIGSASDAWNNDYYDDSYRHNGKLEKYQGYCTDVFFAEAKRWIAEQRQPFFAYIATNAPHGPLFVPEKWSDPYKSHPRALANFFGMIANIDHNLGELDKFLEERNLLDNTILVFLTDNGGTAGVSLFNAGMRGRKVTLWDGGHRVPCFWRWPAGGIGGTAAKAKDLNQLTLVQDVTPTLLDLCRIPRPQGLEFDGGSLAGYLRGNDAQLPDRMAVVQFSRMAVARPQWGDATILYRNWRLVSNNELYDVAADPAQQRNVIAQHAPLARRLRAHYDQWWARQNPRLDSHLPSHIGAPQENPTLLSPTEWADSFFDQAAQIRAANPTNGKWHVQVESDGNYEFTLSRWPRELRVPLRASIPAHTGECGSYPEGVAMDIARSTLHFGYRRESSPVTPPDTEIRFRYTLAEGRYMAQTWFHNPKGEELSGAYFLYARKL
jgi:arylsulfatase A-like enzyme